MRPAREATGWIPGGRARSVLLIDAAMGLLAWAGTAAAGRSPWCVRSPELTRWLRVPVAILAGLLLGALVAWLSSTLTERTRWARTMRDELRDSTRSLSGAPTWLLAGGAALGEELLFRGALLPSCAAHWGAPLAVLVTALAFGLTHVPWNRRLWPWTLSAVAMGAGFGALYLCTGELLAPLVAHAVINERTLRALRALEAQRLRDDRRAAPLQLAAWVGASRRV